MSWKLLKLKPLKPFFFGKSVNFKNTHYASSEYFPQQTQLLGALRLYMMESSKLLKMHKCGKFCSSNKESGARNLANEAKELVGDANSENFANNSNLGKIEFISPLFILKIKDNNIYDALFEIPKDIVKKECNNISYNLAKPIKLNNLLSKNNSIYLQEYDAKEGYSTGLGGEKFWREYIKHSNCEDIISFNKVYKDYFQVGIGIEDGKQVEDGKFYTKKSYNLCSGYEFAFLVKIDDKDLKDEKKLKDGIITLGAENSTFSVKVLDAPKKLKEHTIIKNFIDTKSKKGKKVVLLSDAILENSINSNAYFQIVPFKEPFKMMTSKQESKFEQSTKKTEEKLLTPKGSVFYFDTPNTIQEATGAYKKMGFNLVLAIN